MQVHLRKLSIIVAMLLVPTIQDVLVGQDSQNRDSMTMALEAIPGCLGVKTIKHNDAKIMFVWFKDRDSVITWCKDNNHQMAQGVLKMADPKFEFREPLSAAPNENGPFMVIVSAHPKKDRQFGPGKFPLEYLYMELYKPVPGGLFVNQRFSPEKLKVKGLREFNFGGNKSSAGNKK